MRTSTSPWKSSNEHVHTEHGRAGPALAEAQAQVLDDADKLEAFRIAHFGRQGLLKDLNERFRAVPGPEKRRWARPSMPSSKPFSPILMPPKLL